MLRRRPPGRGIAANPFDPTPDGRVRVGIVTPALCYGGAERWILDLVRWTDPERLRWVGIAVTTHRSVPHTTALAEELCPVGTNLGALARSVEVLLYWGIPQFWREHPEGLAAPRVVAVSHGSGWWTQQVFLGLPDSIEVVAVAQAALEPLAPAVRQRATLLYNGVDPERVRPQRPRAAVRSEWGVPADVPLLGFLGRLSGEKNPLGFVRALAHLPEDWHGVMCGTGPERLSIQEEAARLGVTDRLHLPGFQAHAGDALAAIDTLLMPAHEEGYGLALVEAMLAGVPVISTPVGIVTEVPHLVRSMPLEPSPEQLALAVLRDRWETRITAARVASAQSWAQKHATAARFGEAWTDYLSAKAPRHRAAGPSRTGAGSSSLVQ